MSNLLDYDINLCQMHNMDFEHAKKHMHSIEYQLHKKQSCQGAPKD